MSRSTYISDIVAEAIAKRPARLKQLTKYLRNSRLTFTEFWAYKIHFYRFADGSAVAVREYVLYFPLPPFYVPQDPNGIEVNEPFPHAAGPAEIVEREALERLLNTWL